MRPFLLVLAAGLASAAHGDPGPPTGRPRVPAAPPSGAGGAARLAAPTGIKDGADLFSAQAIAEADKEIAALRDTYHLGVYVETIPELPAEQRAWFRFWDRRRVIHYLVQQAEERAEAAKVDGIYIAICKKPREVRVVVWPPRQQNVFTSRDRERLRKLLAYRLAVDPDRALLDALAQVRSTLANGGREPAVANTYAVAGVFGGLVAGWVVLLVVRRKMRKARVAAGVELPDPYAGGAARLGTLFGVTSAAWGYDRLLPSMPRVPAPAPPEPPAEMEPELHPAPAADDNPENARV